MQNNNSTSLLNKKDYLIITFIGISFALFSIPIIKNLNLAFLEINYFNIIALVIFFAIFANFSLWIAGWLGKRLIVILQFAKFSAIGAFNTFLDWGILNVLILLTGISAGVGYSIFKGISFLVAVFGSYFWNKYWTFQVTDSSDTEEVKKFILVSIIGLVINIGLASFLVWQLNKVSAISPERIANIGAAVATILSLVWNFIGYKLIVFKK